jgi:hypothetical protein
VSEEPIEESAEATHFDEPKTRRIKKPENIMEKLLISAVGALIFMILDIIQWPYTSIGLVKLGFAPALALVAAVGAARGSLTGFLTGYIGKILSDIVLSSSIIAFSLYGFSIGFIGFVVGLGTYDLAKGRSLLKMSVMSSIGLIFAVLLTVAFGLYIEGIAVLVAIGLQMLPMLTVGLPTVILLSPLLARIFDSVAFHTPQEGISS